MRFGLLKSMSITEARDRASAMRASLAEQLHSCGEAREQLQALFKRFEATPQFFDDEDRQRVRDELVRNEEKREHLERELRAEETRRRERKELIRAMKTAIAQRTTVLEDESCLAQHPDMLKFFARKQISLQALLAQKEDEDALSGSCSGVT